VDFDLELAYLYYIIFVSLLLSDIPRPRRSLFGRFVTSFLTCQICSRSHVSRRESMSIHFSSCFIDSLSWCSVGVNLWCTDIGRIHATGNTPIYQGAEQHKEPTIMKAISVRLLLNAGFQRLTEGNTDRSLFFSSPSGIPLFSRERF
jgi:hypothetical protein